jgi:hypothetical protein
MRALLNGNLSLARKLPDGRLVVGLCPSFERFSLAMLVLGLLLVGFQAASFLDGKAVSRVSFLPGLSLIAWSLWLLFLSTKFLFDRDAGQFWLMRPFRETKHWRVEDIQKVMLCGGWDVADLELVLKDGERLLIFRTPWNRAEQHAEPIAAYLNVPFERKEVI